MNFRIIILSRDVEILEIHTAGQEVRNCLCRRADSITAITWYRNKQTASSRRCPALQKAEIFLKVMEARIKDIEVLHWDNRLWGEIPADFGNK